MSICTNLPVEGKRPTTGGSVERLYYVDLTDKDLVGWVTADESEYNRMLAERGILYPTEAEAFDAALRILTMINGESAQ